VSFSARSGDSSATCWRPAVFAPSMRHDVDVLQNSEVHRPSLAPSQGAPFRQGSRCAKLRGSNQLVVAQLNATSAAASPVHLPAAAADLVSSALSAGHVRRLVPAKGAHRKARRTCRTSDAATMPCELIRVVRVAVHRSKQQQSAGGREEGFITARPNRPSNSPALLS
jgi:hypothetical protein